MLISFIGTWLLQVVVGSSAPGQDDLEQAISVLAPQLSSEAVVTFPWQGRWQALQIRSTSPRLAPHYSVVVEVATESDVQATVATASKYDIPFLAVSGTHGWTTTLNKLPYGIQINMRKLNTATLSSDGNVVVVGGGMLQHEITRALFAKGKYTTTGLCECTSVAGPLLGGGHNIIQGQYGYVLDNIISARVVVASGKLVETSQTTNPDLFWALRGAGHNFGIMTSLEMRAYNIPSNWTVYNIAFSGDKLERIYDLVNRFEEPSFNKSSRLAMTSAIIRLPDVDPVNPIINYVLAYEGSEAEAEPYAAHFKALDPISTTVSTDVDYVQLYTVTNNNLNQQPCVKNNNIAGAGISLPAWDIEGIREAYTIFSNLSADARFSKSIILLENYGMQGVRAVDPESTALALEERERPAMTGPVMWWEGNGEQDAQDAYDYIRRMERALFMGLDKSGGKRHTYVNYANGEENRAQLYGYDNRLERLAKLKKVWDPENRFGFYNPVV
ncbi:hypothetical protein DE146DRAFT_695984 [Phaeosphaeria sp. MPI-PUGE-AT-0046c]|nr:hypothetical protein DE146DRAFT_695984 [Phaeosphaeria sp. MPI-PUGE-AT-0046c]